MSRLISSIQQGYLYKRTSSDRWQLRFFLLYQVSIEIIFVESLNQGMEFLNYKLFKK